MTKILIVAFSFLLLSCSHTQSRQVASEKKLKIFDAHTHFDDEKTLKQPSKAMLDEFEEAGVVATVVHLEQYRQKLELTLPNPKVRYAICAGIGPEGESLAEIEKKLKSKAYRCMKIYLGYVPKYATDPFYKPFYKLAEKYNVPIVFHTGDTYDKMALVKYAEPLQLDEIAVTYPKIKFVMAHMGNPWFDSAAEVIYKNDNMYVDLSGFILGDFSQQDPEKIDYLIVKPIRWVYHFVENPKKFLFGSDWPLARISPYVEAVKKAFPEKDWEDVFYWNAMEIFFGEKKPAE